MQVAKYRILGLTLVASLIVLQFSAGLAIAGDRSVTDAKATPAGVHRVVAGGEWSRDGMSGFYRAIVVAGGVEHVSHRLFVQWIAVTRDPEPYRVLQTTAIEELDTGHGSIMTIKAAFPKMEVMRLSVTARDRSGERARHVTVRAKPDRTYSLQDAPSGHGDK